MDLSKLLEGVILVGSFVAASALEAGRAAPVARRVPPAGRVPPSLPRDAVKIERVWYSPELVLRGRSVSTPIIITLRVLKRVENLAAALSLVKGRSVEVELGRVRKRLSVGGSVTVCEPGLWGAGDSWNFAGSVTFFEAGEYVFRVSGGYIHGGRFVECDSVEMLVHVKKPAPPKPTAKGYHLRDFLDIELLSVDGVPKCFDPQCYHSISTRIFYDRVVATEWYDGVEVSERIIRVRPGKYLRWLDPDTVGAELEVEEIGEHPNWDYRDFRMWVVSRVVRLGEAIFKVRLRNGTGWPIGVYYKPLERYVHGGLLAWLEPGESKEIVFHFKVG